MAKPVVCDESALTDIFTQIYEGNLWGGKESRSGPGSDLQSTEKLRKKLQFFFDNFKINSICDIPCGDWHWMKEMDLGDKEYIGCDIIDEIIDKNNANYKSERISFHKLNVIEQVPPKADLIFCKDLLLHMTNDSIKSIINNFKDSGSKYLLVTCHYCVSFYGNNRDIVRARHPEVNKDLPDLDTETRLSETRNHQLGHPIDLTLAPFSLPEPMLVIPWHETANHFLLWKLEDIPAFT